MYHPIRIFGLAAAVALMAGAGMPALDAAGTAGTRAALAQQAGQGTPGGQGGPAGGGSGGTSGGVAGSQGSGAGGSTAGQGENVGGSGASAGPGAVNQNQFGGSVPPAPPPPAPPPAPVQTAQGVPGASPAAAVLARMDQWCGDYDAATLNGPARYEGRNRERLLAVQNELAPGFVAGRRETGMLLIGSYQEEVAKPRPNRIVAAAYLAQASAVPLTTQMLERLNGLLCVSTSQQVLAGIAESAEDQRRASARR